MNDIKKLYETLKNELTNENDKQKLNTELNNILVCIKNDNTKFKFSSGLNDYLKKKIVEFLKKINQNISENISEINKINDEKMKSLVKDKIFNTMKIDIEAQKKQENIKSVSSIQPQIEYKNDEEKSQNSEKNQAQLTKENEEHNEEKMKSLVKDKIFNIMTEEKAEPKEHNIQSQQPTSEKTSKLSNIKKQFTRNPNTFESSQKLSQKLLQQNKYSSLNRQPSNPHTHVSSIQPQIGEKSQNNEKNQDQLTKENDEKMKSLVKDKIFNIMKSEKKEESKTTPTPTPSQHSDIDSRFASINRPPITKKNMFASINRPPTHY